MTRYLFSCLVDADSEDTANFCRVDERPRELKGDFGAALDNVNQKLESFQVETELQTAHKNFCSLINDTIIRYYINDSFFLL